MLDPWCFTPDQIAKLTRWQVENLYLNPAEKQSQELERSLQGKTKHDDDGDVVEFSNLEEFIAAMQIHFPEKTAEEWAVDWEAMQDNARENP